MKIFVIPSWYPSADYPIAGVFIQEQVRLYADQFSEDQVGVSLWGAHDRSLWLHANDWLSIPKKLLRGKPKPFSNTVRNLATFFYPAYTWSRRVFNGNISGIISANERNLKSFTDLYGKPDIIHAHIAYPGGYIAWQLSLKYDIPFVITENMSPFPMEGLRYGFDKYVLSPLKEASRVVAVSQHFSHQLAGYGIRSEVLPNFIDDHFFQLPETKKQILEKVSFLTVGRLEEQKGHVHLIEACHKLVGKIDFKLVIIGEGSLRKNLETTTKKLGLQHHVFFKGSGNAAIIREAIYQCDIFVFPSLHESFGIAPLEALACGKPVIGTPVGVLPDVINDKTGCMVESGNAAKLANTMQSMYKSIRGYDPVVIRDCYYAYFSKSTILTRLKQLYESVIKE